MFVFGDGFDLYATTADPGMGFWDSSGTGAFNLTTGRFTGSQAIGSLSTGGNNCLTKASGSNDAVHHIFLAYWNSAALTGSNLNYNLQLQDGVTTQCSIVFRSDGAILLTSGGPAGSVLATYTGAVNATSTWFAFEFEVVINNTSGSFTVRKNGNTSNDFTLGSLNTRTTANSYANKLFVHQQTGSGANFQKIDDILWRSDAASVAWVGDIRCYTRMPASDVSTQFARAPNPATNTTAVASSRSDGTTTSGYSPFTPLVSGTVGSILVNVNTAFTGNLKCSIFADTGSNQVGTVLGSATVVVNPAAGNNTCTFSTPVPVVKGTQYWFGVSHDVTAIMSVGSGVTGRSTTAVTYAAFPTATPGGTSAVAPIAGTVNITPTISADFVSEAQQDGTTSYVYDSTVGHADLYGIAPLSGTPASTVAVTTRGFLQKSDAGTRNAAVQLKSGGTTVQSTSTALSTSFTWLWRTDTNDPNTGSAWSAVAVNNCAIGPIVTG